MSRSSPAKYLLMAALTVAAGALAGVAVAASEAALPARVQVAWPPADQLSEVKNNQMHRGWIRPAEWMKTLGDYLRVRADRVLPAGQQLTVDIEDISLAGSFEPWHGPNLQDIRYMKDIYPPRLTLHYKLTAGDGSVLGDRSAKLVDLNYLQRSLTFSSTDPLRYDKRLIDDWINREFRPR